MKLKEALNKKKFVVTSEVQSPVDESPQTLIKSMNLVRGRLDGISVSDIEIEGVVGDNIKTCDLLNQNRFEAIYQTTTRQKNRIELQRDLVNAHNAGVDNLLVFTEDYRISGDTLQEMMFFHVDSGKLSSVLELTKEGQTVDGQDLNLKADFTLGSGIESSWGSDIPDLEMQELETMTDMGTGYFLTTPVFDLDKFQKFMKRVNTFGVPVIAEVMILRTAGMAKFFNSHFKSGLVPEWIIEKLSQATEKDKASIEVFADTIAGLKEICQGVHIITIGGEQNLRHYLDAAKLT